MAQEADDAEEDLGDLARSHARLGDLLLDLLDDEARKWHREAVLLHEDHAVLIYCQLRS